MFWGALIAGGTSKHGRVILRRNVDKGAFKQPLQASPGRIRESEPEAPAVRQRALFPIVGKAHAVQMEVGPVLGEQFSMIALLHDAALLENDDQVGIDDRG